MKAKAALAFISLGMLCCFSGCRHQTHATRPTAMPPAEPVRRFNPKVTVMTNNQGPIKYQWGFTTNAEGTKVLRFVPNQ